MFDIFNRVAYDVSLEMFPDYSGIKQEVFVRITDLPISDSIRDLRCAIAAASCTAGRERCRILQRSLCRRPSTGLGRAVASC